MNHPAKKREEESKKIKPFYILKEEKKTKPSEFGQKLLEEVKKDMGKVALFVSSMAVVLMVLFYFTLKHTVVKTETKVNSMVQKMRIIDKKVAELESLPQKTRNLIYYNMLEEIYDKTKFLSSRLDQNRKEKLLEALKLIKEAQKGLNK